MQVSMHALAGTSWTNPLTELTSERFLPHGYCYLWNRQLLTLHVISDGLIFLSYVAISLSLWWLLHRERQRLPFRWILGAFGLFIVSCGLTHAMEIVVLWRPLYWMAGDLKLITAVASVTTAVALPFLFPDISNLLTAARNSRRNELRFLAASASSQHAFMILDSVRGEAGRIIDFRFSFLNTRAGDLLSSTPEHLRGELLCALFPLSRIEGLFARFQQVVGSGRRFEGEFPVTWPAVRASWLRLEVVRLDDGIALTAVDISALKESEDRLARLATLKKNIIASSPLATIVIDQQGTILAFNVAAERMLWYRQEELVDLETPLLFLHPQEIERRAWALRDELRQPISSGTDVFLAKARLGLMDASNWTFYRRGGTHFLVEISTNALTDGDGAFSGAILIAHDITKRKHAEAYIAHLAHHDALTGLPTRTLLQDRLSMCVAHAARQQTKAALMVLDIDHFKRVNDMLGHDAGDQLLKVIAHRLQATIRGSDTVARMGGDEFVVVLDGIHNLAEAEHVAEKLLEAVRTPVSIGSQTIRPTITMGICMYPDNASDPESMLRNADQAMYRSKASGRNGYRTFTDAMNVEASRKRQIEASLQSALAGDEFSLVYQPQVSLRSGVVTGVEALLRWHSKTLGTMMPGEFVPLAEEIGLMRPIGEWVLQNACMEGARLQAALGRKLTIAVNISPSQLHDTNLPFVLDQSLSRSGLDAGSLEVEVTESVLLGESPEPLAMLEEFRARGVRLALDGFGTGCSSMAYMLRFRINRIKMDRSLVRDMTHDAESSATAGSILAIGAALSVAVIAGGVETAEQLDLLRSKGCEEAQGFYFAAPVSSEHLAEMITAIEGHPSEISLEHS